MKRFIADYWLLLALFAFFGLTIWIIVETTVGSFMEDCRASGRSEAECRFQFKMRQRP